ncbi:hypothetical protein BT96DRAFT_1006902 [Gymnopus androsaceus JB14]|uniref:Uncharacterized protein n=1 Tax=Gymnopus androsaceus JB14 TaxID=1447944 RepID=A0A6A4GJ96_9AGAR|nr:hypothetical protein BT96DRAFT_1006902 [Gymnopus androsaceus JB14]
MKNFYHAYVPFKSQLTIHTIYGPRFTVLSHRLQQAASMLISDNVLHVALRVLHRPSIMPRTVYPVCTTSAVTLLSIRVYFISTVSQQGCFVPLPTATPKSEHNDIRRPHIDFWLPAVSQAYIHRVIVHFKGEHFALYFQRYCALPENHLLNIRGNLVILRMGKRNPLNPVNMKAGKRSDAKKARTIAKK